MSMLPESAIGTIEKLVPKVDEIIHIAIDRKLPRDEVESIITQLRGHFPDVRFIVSLPGTTVRVNNDEQPPPVPPIEPQPHLSSIR